MKVYVTGSSLMPKNQETLRSVVDTLRADGHEVFTNVFSKERPTRALATEHLLSNPRIQRRHSAMLFPGV